MKENPYIEGKVEDIGSREGYTIPYGQFWEREPTKITVFSCNNFVLRDVCGSRLVCTGGRPLLVGVMCCLVSSPTCSDVGGCPWQCVY
jgi:hypothetical protein